MAQTRPIETAKTSASSTTQLERSFVARSSSRPLIIDDHIKVLPPAPPEPRNQKSGLPHKWRPLSEYTLCDTELLKKHGVIKPDVTYNTFNVYIKRKDIGSDNPTFYFIKFNTPGSYLSEFEAFNAAIHNFFVEDIIPSAHVIYDDSTPENLPVAVCTRFDKSFITIKKKPIVENDLAITEKDAEDTRKVSVVKCIAIIIILAQLLEECDLHGNNFVWTDSEKLPIKRVDVGQALWNFLIKNPKMKPELMAFIKRVFGWTDTQDIFPLTVEEFKTAPNFKTASPRYCPGGSEGSIFSQGSTWFSKNAFTTAELEVYRKPKNLQENPIFKYVEYKLATKFALLSDATKQELDVIEEFARLYLRANEGPKDKPAPLTHIEDVTKHLKERMQKCRDTLTQSDEFKTFAKKYFATAMNEIHDERDAFSDKIAKKMQKPQSKAAYARMFACLNPENPEATLTEEIIKKKAESLDRDTFNIRI